MNIHLDGVITLVLMALYFWFIHKMIKKLVLKIQGEITDFEKVIYIFITVPVGLSVPIIVIALLSTFLGEKHALDRQMDKLCKKDGGVRIYETIKLSPEMYNDVVNRKAIKTVSKNGGYVSQIFNDYEERNEPLIIKDSNLDKRQGRLTRNHIVLERLSDKKTLAEEVYYSRSGGDIWTFGGVPTSASCPKETSGLIEKVFIK